MKAVVCPVCQGSGTYKWSYPADTVVEHSKVCHGCWGKGWVEVQSDHMIHIEDTLGYHAPEDCCPACGQKRTEQPLTSCPQGSHYGSYCSV